MKTSFEKELAELINRYSLEGGSDTPDFLLANSMYQHLASLQSTIKTREEWYGRSKQPAPVLEDTPVPTAPKEEG